MIKNIKSIFFILTLVMLLVTVGAVCAAEDNGATTDNTTSTSSISEKTSTTTSEVLVKEVQKQESHEKQANKKEKIIKENKTRKNTKESVTIDGIEYTKVVENQEITDDYLEVGEVNTMYNNCTFSNTGGYIYIMMMWDNVEDKPLLNHVLINNSKINTMIESAAYLHIHNSTINNELYTQGQYISIDESSALGEKFNIDTFDNPAIISTKNQQVIEKLIEKGIYASEYSIENKVLNTPITNLNNLNIKNCTLNSTIWNEGILIIDDNTIIGEKFRLERIWTEELQNKNAKVVINDSTRVGLYEGEIYNKTINTNITTNNVTFINCQINAKITNQGNLTLQNCTLSNNNMTITGTTNGFYLENRGNATLIDCYVENNTFNSTINPQYSYKFTLIGAVYNKGNMTVDNCTFRNNSVGYRYHVNDGSYFGTDYFIGDASCIYNIGNLSIKESLFENNYAGKDGAAILSTQITQNLYNETAENYGTRVINDGSVQIDNTTFRNNTAATTGMTLSITGSNNLIENCAITDNINAKNLILKNNTINRGIRITNNLTLTSNNINTSLTAYNIIAKNNTLQNGTLTVTGNAEITNNTFTTQSRIQLDYPQNCNIYDNTYLNASIRDQLTLNIPNKIYAGEPLTITGTYTINTPEYYDPDILDQNKFQLYINDELNQTSDTLEFTITPTNGTMMVTVQPTISQTRKTEAIRATTLTDITITPENYNEYLYEGVLVGVSKDTRVKFSGEFTDKGDIVFDTNDLIIDGTNATFTNTTFTLDNENITLTNMNINNNEIQYTITNTFNNNIIANNTITLTNTQKTGAAIYNTASNTLIENNTITQTAPADNVDFSTGQGVASTQAILLLGGDKNTVQNNNINIKASSSSAYGTLEAITNNNDATNTIITQNTINISGANFNYAIDSLNNVENITITENTITVTGERYCDGIQAGNGATNILIDNNNITCVCINTTELTTEGAITYGVIATSMGSEESENITITNNNIDITGTANYGIELYKVSNTEVHNNTITVNGPFSMGIGYGYSSNGNATGNTITTTGDSTTPINQITEEFKPENVGIRIQNGTMNVSITGNTITTSDVGGQDTTINTDPDNVTIANNQLTSSQGYGDETIKAPTNATIENNTIETTTTIEVPETIITKTPTTITANVTTIDGTPINDGTITFTQGNEAIAQAEVIDGVATTTVTFKEAEDTTIVASYTPESTGLTTSSAEATTTIQAPQTQLNIEDVNLTSGETVILTTTVTDQVGNNITGGKIIFKVNGKTVKDANGKVIYAKVVNGVATVEYTVPDSLAGKDVNITAVYSGSTKYNKESTTITKTVTAPETTLTITPITSDVQTGSTITLKAKIAAGDKAITTGKIVFKINGKTVKDANGKVIYAKVDANGEVSVDYNLGNLKAGTYTLEAVFIAPNYDKITSNSTMTIVKA